MNACRGRTWAAPCRVYIDVWWEAKGGENGHGDTVGEGGRGVFWCLW